MTNIDGYVVSRDEINELAFDAQEIVNDAEFLLERFALDESYSIIDKLNPTGPKYSYCRLDEDPAEDQRRLREVVLWRRLDDLVDDLILNLKPERTNYQGSEEPVCPLEAALAVAILGRRPQRWASYWYVFTKCVF